MLLTISTTHQPATDLGFLLHKNPARVQSEELPFGRAHVFYPSAGLDRCTAALFVEVVVVIGLKTGGRLSHEADIHSSFGRPYEIGRLFLTDQLLAFEITSIVLLIAAVGGVILGSHSRLEPSLGGDDAGA